MYLLTTFLAHPSHFPASPLIINLLNTYNLLTTLPAHHHHNYLLDTIQTSHRYLTAWTKYLHEPLRPKEGREWQKLHGFRRIEAYERRFLTENLGAVEKAFGDVVKEMVRVLDQLDEKPDTGTVVPDGLWEEVLGLVVEGRDLVKMLVEVLPLTGSLVEYEPNAPIS